MTRWNDWHALVTPAVTPVEAGAGSREPLLPLMAFPGFRSGLRWNDEKEGAGMTAPERQGCNARPK